MFSGVLFNKFFTTIRLNTIRLTNNYLIIIDLWMHTAKVLSKSPAGVLVYGGIRKSVGVQVTRETLEVVSRDFWFAVIAIVSTIVCWVFFRPKSLRFLCVLKGEGDHTTIAPFLLKDVVSRECSSSRSFRPLKGDRSEVPFDDAGTVFELLDPIFGVFFGRGIFRAREMWDFMLETPRHHHLSVFYV